MSHSFDGGDAVVAVGDDAGTAATMGVIVRGDGWGGDAAGLGTFDTAATGGVMSVGRGDDTAPPILVRTCELLLAGL